MAFPVPRSLSPSKVSSFTDCALAFRFAAIDRLPEPPSIAATKGTLVHTALERLHLLPPHERSVEAGLACLDEAAAGLRGHPDYDELGLAADDEAAFHADAATLVRNYFRLEDPRAVRAIGLELSLEADLDGVTLRGIIDRLELDGDGELVVTDYKTGAPPSTQHERKRLSGVHIYSLLCEQLLGRRPRRVQLLYLRSPLAILTEPTDQSTRGTRRTLGAVWQAVERACAREDFRPNPSRLCDYCAFHAYCPAVGGDPSLVPPPVVDGGAAPGEPDDPRVPAAGASAATTPTPVHPTGTPGASGTSDATGASEGTGTSDDGRQSAGPGGDAPRQLELAT